MYYVLLTIKTIKQCFTSLKKIIIFKHALGLGVSTGFILTTTTSDLSMLHTCVCI